MDSRLHYQWTKSDVAMAVRRNEFVPFFQPKIDLSTGASSGVEMLARWNHPALGILPPSQFIRLVEHAGLIDRFTDDLLRQSLVRAAAGAAAGRQAGIAVNFSALTLQDPQASRRICSLVREYGISCDRITIEITENRMPEQLSPVIKSLTFLRSQGFKISIDDFGTGYSSLKLLSKIPFTELKIDRMFIAGIPENRKLTGILEATMHLARTLGLDTVAEGIETRAQLDFIRMLGCDVGQGFYLGMPAPGLATRKTMKDAQPALA